jgi:hypothetical protein
LFTDVLDAFVSPMQAGGIGLAPDTWTSGPSLNGAADAPGNAASVSVTRQSAASAARGLNPKDLTSPRVNDWENQRTPASTSTVLAVSDTFLPGSGRDRTRLEADRGHIHWL